MFDNWCPSLWRLKLNQYVNGSSTKRPGSRSCLTPAQSACLSLTPEHMSWSPEMWTRGQCNYPTPRLWCDTGIRSRSMEKGFLTQSLRFQECCLQPDRRSVEQAASTTLYMYTANYSATLINRDKLMVRYQSQNHTFKVIFHDKNLLTLIRILLNEMMLCKQDSRLLFEKNYQMTRKWVQYIITTSLECHRFKLPNLYDSKSMGISS